MTRRRFVFASIALAGVALLTISARPRLVRFGEEMRACSVGERVLDGPRAGVTGVQFSDDGEWLASTALDGVLRVWSTDDWRLEQSWPTGSELYAVAFEPGGRRVAATDQDGRVVLGNVDTGELKVAHRVSGWSVALAFTPKGRLLVGTIDGDVLQLDLEGGTVERTIHTGSSLLGLAISADGRRLATTIPLRLFDLETGNPVGSFAAFGHGGVAFAPDAALIASGEGTGGVCAFAVATGRSVGNLRIEVMREGFGPAGPTTFAVNMPVSSVAFSRDGGLLATGATDSEVKLWKVEAGAIVAPAARRLAGHRMTVTGVTFSPDGRRLATSSLDRTVRVWELTSP